MSLESSPPPLPIPGLVTNSAGLIEPTPTVVTRGTGCFISDREARAGSFLGVTAKITAEAALGP